MTIEDIWKQVEMVGNTGAESGTSENDATNTSTNQVIGAGALESTAIHTSANQEVESGAS